MVERRGNLAGDVSTRLSHVRSQLARDICRDPDARWLGHVGGGDRLSVFYLSTPHPEGLELRDDRTACGHGALPGARLFFERDDSPDRLSLSDSRRDPRGHPGAAHRTRATPATPGAAPRGHLPCASGPRGQGASGLSDDFTPLVRRLMARDQIPGVAVGLVERGHLVFARGFGYRDASRTSQSRPTRSLLSDPVRRLSRRRRSLCLRTREESRSTLPSARTFPTLPSQIRWRRRP